MRTFTEWDKAVAAQEQAADPTQVCGTFVGEQPVYYLMAAEATDEQIREAAFEVRNGRKMSVYERFLLGQAEARVAS